MEALGSIQQAVATLDRRHQPPLVAEAARFTTLAGGDLARIVVREPGISTVLTIMVTSVRDTIWLRAGLGWFPRGLLPSEPLLDMLARTTRLGITITETDDDFSLTIDTAFTLDRRGPDAREEQIAESIEQMRVGNRSIRRMLDVRDRSGEVRDHLRRRLATVLADRISRSPSEQQPE